MIIQVKTGRGADSHGIRCGGTDADIEFQAIATQGHRSDWFGLGASFGSNSFQTFDLPIPFGLFDVRGGAFRLKGHPSADSWHLEFFNVTDGSSGIWRSEPRQCLTVRDDGAWTEYEFAFARSNGLRLFADQDNYARSREHRAESIERHPGTWKRKLRGRDFFPTPGAVYRIHSTGNSQWSLMALASIAILAADAVFYDCGLSADYDDSTTHWEFLPIGSSGAGQIYEIRNVGTGRLLSRDRVATTISRVEVEAATGDVKAHWRVDYAPDDYWFQFSHPERDALKMVVKSSDIVLCKVLSDHELEDFLQEFSIVPIM